MSLQLKELTAYIETNRNKIKACQRESLTRLMQAFNDGSMILTSWESKTSNLVPGCMMLVVEYLTSPRGRGQGVQRYYVENHEYFKATGTDIHAHIAKLEENGAVAKLEAEHLSNLLFGAMAFDEDAEDMADAVLEYRIRDGELVHIHLSRHAGMMSVEYPVTPRAGIQA